MTAFEGSFLMLLGLATLIIVAALVVPTIADNIRWRRACRRQPRKLTIACVWCRAHTQCRRCMKRTPMECGQCGGWCGSCYVE